MRSGALAAIRRALTVPYVKTAKEDALAKADALSARASELRKRWYGARFAAARDAAKNAVKQLGVTIGEGIESAGQKMKDAVAGDDGQGVGTTEEQ